MRIVVPVDTSEGLKSKVSFLFGRAPYLAIVDYEGEVRRVKVENNTYAQIPGGVGPALAQSLWEKGVNVVLASGVGPNAAAILASAGINWIPVPAGITVEEALNYLSNSQQISPPLSLTYPFPSKEEEIRWLRERKKWIENKL